MASLKGRRALITGGGRGIGRIVALDIARAGGDVAVCARSTGEVEAVAREAQALGVRALALRLDVTSPEQVRERVGDAAERLGGIDILVNGAGVAPSALVTRTTDEQWRAALETNLSGAFYCMRETLPGMQERGWGRVVNVASIASWTGARYIAAYAASKHGVLGLTRSAALEVAMSGVTVNAVCPGYVDTPMTDASIASIAAKTRLSPEAIRERLENSSPQRRLFSPEEVSALVLFLLGDDARGINGQGIILEGGGVS